MKLLVAFAPIVLFSSLSFACGGRFSEVDDTNDAGLTPDGGGTSDSGASDGGSSGPCPATSPAAGSACSSPGVKCEYGNYFDPSCDMQASCEQGSWHIHPPVQDRCPQDPGIGSGCPKTLGDVTQGDSCQPFGLECTYPDGRCACTTFGGPTPVDAGSGTWHCIEDGRKCPYPRPRIGSTCSKDGTVCDYGGCFLQGGSTLSCKNGVWVDTPSACPL